jgi:acyl-CoA dehydrogenase
MIANDAMDLHGGKGICLGPRSYLGRGYQIVPVAITVEGANILTRSLIIFGQGAVRCHPFVLREMNAAKNPDRESGLIDAAEAAMLRDYDAKVLEIIAVDDFAPQELGVGAAAAS